jgi:hypothetical protein
MLLSAASFFTANPAIGQQTPDAPKAPAAPSTSPKANASDDSEQPAKPRDLGPPLVEKAADLKQLGKYKAWLDPKGKQVVLVAETCSADYPLEFLVTAHDRAYESVLTIDGRRSSEKGMSIYMEIHKALLLLGAVPGKPSRYDEAKQTMTAATGTELLINLRWKDKEGKLQNSNARDWIQYKESKKPLETNWVFAGSKFSEDGEGHQFYGADGGDFICVLNSPIAMIDLPVNSARAIEDRMFVAFKDRLPPAGTPVTIFIKPVVKKK